jgi:hypothetical protein
MAGGCAADWLGLKLMLAELTSQSAAGLQTGQCEAAQAAHNCVQVKRTEGKDGKTNRKPASSKQNVSDDAWT